MSKKRKRDSTSIDVPLVAIYEDLASEHEDVRLGAAHSLLSKLSGSGALEVEQIQTVLKRLFRGLCSGRKSARLGFSVALSELLVQLHVHGTVGHGISVSEIIDMLDGQTRCEGSSSGQDERDHYFGRLFGAEAIVNSQILTRYHDLTQWSRLLCYICEIAKKKPWMRQECGWVLYNAVGLIAPTADLHEFALKIIGALDSHSLIRTPEGVAVWLRVRKAFPELALPTKIWKYNDPLARKDVSNLAAILKDAKSNTASAEDGFESQGSAMWSAQIHFAWEIVLSELYSTNEGASKTEAKVRSHRVDFENFWKEAVDESLFSSSSSPERKHWGLLVLAKAFSSAPSTDLPSTFSTKAIRCLLTVFKGDERYLRKSAQKAFRALGTRLKAEPALRRTCLKPLVYASDFVDIDSLTKERAMQTILHPDDAETSMGIECDLWGLYVDAASSDAVERARRRKAVINLQSKQFGLLLLPPGLPVAQGKEDTTWPTELFLNIGLFILSRWMGQAIADSSHPDVQADPETRDLIKTRLTSSFEQGLKSGPIGIRILCQTMSRFHNEHPDAGDFDEEIRETVDRAWAKLKAISVTWEKRQRPQKPREGRGNAASGGKLEATFQDGLALLYSLTLFQVYTEDAEAVEILEELMAYHEEQDQQTTLSSNEVHGSDALVEILLSFASKPSKLMRRISLQIFEAIASQLTANGLHSLIRVLAAKETKQGQEEMFEARDHDGEEDDNNEDEETLDSDVEMVEADVDDGSSQATSSSDSDASEDELNMTDDENGGEDAALVQFESKLAAALGTRRGKDDVDAGDSSGSDSDMDDDAMMTLDDKLTEVFRTQKQANGRKKEAKDAKANIVNFKNRVLDLADVYLKHQTRNPLSLELLLPLLHLAQKTNTKQLADRACSILREFCSRCKGPNVPILARDQPDAHVWVLGILQDVHVEAGQEQSNTRAAACSAASLLLVKTVVHDGNYVEDVIRIYGQTREAQLTQKKCRVQPGFFTDWNNWCAQARNQLAE